MANKGVYNLSNGYNWADKVICVSRQLSESLRKKFGVDSIVIHNMVSDDFYLGKVHKNLSNTVRFISIGALLERKGFDILINAFAKSEKLSQCSLCIIGSGKEETKLSKLIEQNSLQNKVFLLGRKLPNEVNKLISDSDCFILTSRRETFGIVYIEAMAKGKPVIATICGGPESFVNDSNGILIPTEDVEAATKAIDYMVENVDKYDNAAIRQYCHDNFSEEAISQKIITVYKEVLKQRNK